MSGIRAPDKEKIKKAYETGNYTFKKLSEEFRISLGTIKSWAKRDKDNGQPWIKNKSKKVATKDNRVATKSKVKNIKEEPIAKEVKEVLENTELTDKQRLFCIYYIKYFNATKAYQKAYNSSYAVANVEGYRLLVKPSIKAEIDNLKEIKLNRAMLSPEDVFQKYIDIAFADITDYVEFGQEEVSVMGAFGPVVDKETGEPVTKIVNTVKFKESVEVDGTIVSEVKQGKDGASIKLQDKMKALQWLSDRLDLLPTETKIKIDNEKAKVRMAQEKLELEKSKVNGDETEVEDDGFLEALKGRTAEVWNNE